MYKFLFSTSRALLSVRSQFGMLEDSARFQLISLLIRETVTCGKSLLASSVVTMEESLDPGCKDKETSNIKSLIQADKVLSAVCLNNSLFAPVCGRLNFCKGKSLC